MNQPIHNDYWLSRFESILNSALVQHRAVSLIRVDLRFPEHMPVTIMDPDPDSAVISRFRIPESQNSGLPAEKRRTNKRVRATTLHYFWCREFGKGKKAGNIIVILLLNKDTGARRGFHRSFFAGDADQLAWCSALHLEPGRVMDWFIFPGGRLSVNRHHLMLALLPMIRLCRVDVLKPGKASDKSRVKPLFSGSSVVMWKRCRKPWREPVIS